MWERSKGEKRDTMKMRQEGEIEEWLCLKRMQNGDKIGTKQEINNGEQWGV